MTILIRDLLKPGATGINVSPTSDGDIWAALAPAEQLEADFRRRAISWKQYAETYRAFLEWVPESLWDLLAERPLVRLLCHCPLEKPCHVDLLIQHAIRKWPRRFTSQRTQSRFFFFQPYLGRRPARPRSETPCSPSDEPVAWPRVDLRTWQSRHGSISYPLSLLSPRRIPWIPMSSFSQAASSTSRNCNICPPAPR